MACLQQELGNKVTTSYKPRNISASVWKDANTRERKQLSHFARLPPSYVPKFTHRHLNWDFVEYTVLCHAYYRGAAVLDTFLESDGRWAPAVAHVRSLLPHERRGEGSAASPIQID